MAQRRHSMITAAAAMLLGAGLAGCAGGSGVATGSGYGNNLMFDTLTGAGIIPQRKEAIDYAPRTGLVMPTAPGALPMPEGRRVVTNPDWPQDARNPTTEGALAGLTPREQRRSIYARIVGAGGGAPRDRGPVLSDDDAKRAAVDRFRDQRREVRQQIDERRGQTLDPTGVQTRRFLTDPPLTYRAPVETTVDGEIVTRQATLAEPERKRGLRRLLPF